jgi:hypothetical protein
MIRPTERDNATDLSETQSCGRFSIDPETVRDTLVIWEGAVAFAKIPLNFEAMNKAYRDNKSLPPDVKNWLKDVNDREEADNEKIRRENEDRVARGEEPKKLVHKSTSCCMQASLSFNATRAPIPKQGTRQDRDNLTLDGKNYILTADEFRAYLTYYYGPTDQFGDPAEIKGRKGVVIFSNAHIEFWDGEDYFQSAKGLEKRKGNSGAVMLPSFLNTTPRWFWEIDDGSAKSSATTPEWVRGWWDVWDGNRYYYFFFEDGHVVWIDTQPAPKWIPSKNIGNSGTVTMTEHGLKIVWKQLKSAAKPTEEEFTRMNWSSETEMFGTSNNYSPLGAKKMTW